MTLDIKELENLLEQENQNSKFSILNSDVVVISDLLVKLKDYLVKKPIFFKNSKGKIFIQTDCLEGVFVPVDLLMLKK